mmetsp:Transcript_5115/g.8842  ORF Transcript_5115/g.8842 Transcript_5115/m.8842 type:complete len:92 (+) Transcript_5115:267-542(+)
MHAHQSLSLSLSLTRTPSFSLSLSLSCYIYIKMYIAMLVFGRNMLSGTIPQQICNLWDFDLKTMIDGCDMAYGGLECPSRQCCRECFNMAN